MVFRFRQKIYKWTPRVWQAVKLLMLGIIGIVSWVYLLGSIPNLDKVKREGEEGNARSI